MYLFKHVFLRQLGEPTTIPVREDESIGVRQGRPFTMDTIGWCDRWMMRLDGGSCLSCPIRLYCIRGSLNSQGSR